jgi:hypothetical protein
VAQRSVKAFFPALENQIHVQAYAALRGPRPQKFTSPAFEAVSHDRGSDLAWDRPSAADHAQFRGHQVHQKPGVHMKTPPLALQMQKIFASGQRAEAPLIFHPFSQSAFYGLSRVGATTLFARS